MRASLDDIAARMKLPPNRIAELLESAKRKMYAARLQRPTPFVDKTVHRLIDFISKKSGKPVRHVPILWERQ